jgi:hypothetical protein
MDLSPSQEAASFAAAQELSGISRNPVVVRGPGYRSRGPGSISCGTRFSEK